MISDSLLALCPFRFIPVLFRRDLSSPNLPKQKEHFPLQKCFDIVCENEHCLTFLK